MHVEDEDAPGRWIATASALVTFLLVFGVVGVYAYGRAQPAQVTVTVVAAVQAPQDAVWDLLSDLDRRPDWRVQVERIGRIDDDDEGREVWRELDASGDRFDFAVVEREAPDRLVLAVASEDQIGMQGRWTWALSTKPSGTQVTLTEVTAIDNPLWRGVQRLSLGPYANVEAEIEQLALHLRAPVAIERL